MSPVGRRIREHAGHAVDRAGRGGASVQRNLLGNAVPDEGEIRQELPAPGAGHAAHPGTHQG